MSTDLRIGGLDRGPVVTFTFAGRAVQAHAGETVAMALWAERQQTLRRSSRDGEPRGLLCNMGICFECLVRVDGALVRACLVPVQAGLVVEPGGKP
ncbi:MAG TPA: (2Fe-2S)-binding protein [Planctomycetota bacterium]|nr:(2Fe-2S)-binding protein [Planctomycetota bacterium]